jgi:alkylated DNA repair dioxygenase AlkB
MLALWYDGSLGHYIGKHRDSTIDLIKGAPIVTISLGESRTFRMRPHKGIGFQDFVVDNGSVCVIPYATNEKWTHEVPPSRRLQGKRISLTMRAFK